MLPTHKFMFCTDSLSLRCWFQSSSCSIFSTIGRRHPSADIQNCFSAWTEISDQKFTKFFTHGDESTPFKTYDPRRYTDLSPWGWASVNPNHSQPFWGENPQGSTGLEVRSFSGGFMFYFNHAYAAWQEVELPMGLEKNLLPSVTLM